MMCSNIDHPIKSLATFSVFEILKYITMIKLCNLLEAILSVFGLKDCISFS